jgi:hypothetical protein
MNSLFLDVPFQQCLSAGLELENKPYTEVLGTRIRLNFETGHGRYEDKGCMDPSLSMRLPVLLCDCVI